MNDLPPRLDEIDDTYEPKDIERPPEVVVVPKKKGRPKNENYLSYEEARDFMRNEMVPSRNKFDEWWDRNKPKAIPRFPYRVYTNSWISWNDFLGNNNSFAEKRGIKYRPLDEATQWVHTLKLKSYREWMEYCRNEFNNKPQDIPSRPELVYDKWKSWNHWLGNKPVPALEVHQAAQSTQVYYIIRTKDVPQNVITYGVDPHGLSSIKSKWERDKFDILALFWNDPLRAPIIKQVVEAYSTPYLGQSNVRITFNVYEIITVLQSQLVQITAKDVN